MIPHGQVVRPVDETRLWRVLGDTCFGVYVERDRRVRVVPRDRLAVLTPEELEGWPRQPWDDPQSLEGFALIDLTNDGVPWDADLLPPPMRLLTTRHRVGKEAI